MAVSDPGIVAVATERLSRFSAWALIRGRQRRQHCLTRSDRTDWNLESALGVLAGEVLELVANIGDDRVAGLLDLSPFSALEWHD